MFPFKRKKRVANVVIDDYVIRMIENNGQELSTVKMIKEKPLPVGLIEHGKVVDELNFYELIKELVNEWGIKNRDVRFYVPDSLVIMKNVDIPANIPRKDVNEHFMLEVGLSLHLPFQTPVLDVHIHPEEKDEEEEFGDEAKKQHGTLFAVPEEEMIKFTEIFADVSLQPTVADVRALGIYRYFHHLELVKEDEVYMFFELNLTSINLSIFCNHELEFLRYMDLDLDVSHWVSESDEEHSLRWTYKGDEAQIVGQIDDHISELERIMNFYRYSMHKGQKVVTQIVVLGDFPNLIEVLKKVENRYEIPATLLDAELPTTKFGKIPRAFIPALGLALKGGE